MGFTTLGSKGREGPCLVRARCLSPPRQAVGLSGEGSPTAGASSLGTRPAAPGGHRAPTGPSLGLAGPPAPHFARPPPADGQHCGQRVRLPWREAVPPISGGARAPVCTCKPCSEDNPLTLFRGERQAPGAAPAAPPVKYGEAEGSWVAWGSRPAGLSSHFRRARGFHPAIAAASPKPGTARRHTPGQRWGLA